MGIYIIGFIYKLLCLCGCNDFYIGSTTESLQHRFYNHVYKSKHRNSKLYKHMREVGVHNFKIVLLKEVKFEKKYDEDLRMVETEYCHTLHPRFNTRNPYEDHETLLFRKRIDKIKYRANNKENIKEQRKKHYKNNKDKVDAANRKYAEKNKDKIKEYQQVYRTENQSTQKKTKIELMLNEEKEI